MEIKEKLINQFSAASKVLEEVRLEKQNKRTKTTYLAILFTIICFVGGLDLEPQAIFPKGMAILVFSIGGLGAFFFIFYRRELEQSYREYYKKNIIRIFVKEINEDVHYIYDKDNIPPSPKGSKLTLALKGLEEEDYLHGKTPLGYRFQFWELHDSSKKYEDDKAKKHKERRLFYEITNHKMNFEEITILPKKEGVVDKLVTKFFNKNSKGFVKVSDIHPTFDNDYLIYTKNINEAEVLFDFDLLQTIIEINKTLRDKMQFSFIADKVYIDLPINKDFFDTDITESVLENKFTKMLYDDLALSFSVIEKITNQLEIMSQDKDRVRLKDKDSNWSDDAYDHLI